MTVPFVAGLVPSWWVVAKISSTSAARGRSRPQNVQSKRTDGSARWAMADAAITVVRQLIAP